MSPHDRAWFAAQVTPDGVYLYVRADQRARKSAEPWKYTLRVQKAARLTAWEVLAFCDHAKAHNLKVAQGEW